MILYLKNAPSVLVDSISVSFTSYSLPSNSQTARRSCWTNWSKPFIGAAFSACLLLGISSRAPFVALMEAAGHRAQMLFKAMDPKGPVVVPPHMSQIGLAHSFSSERQFIGDAPSTYRTLRASPRSRFGVQAQPAGSSAGEWPQKAT